MPLANNLTQNKHEILNDHASTAFPIAYQMMPANKVYKLPGWPCFLSILVTWVLVILFFSLADYADLIKIGKPKAFVFVLAMSAISFLSYILLSALLAIIFENLPEHWLTAKYLLIMYALVILLFLPLEICYEVSTVYLLIKEKSPPPVLLMLTDTSAMAWWLLGFQASVAYFMQVAITLWQRGREQALRTQDLRQKNLMLRLSLMQCQLEPYFLLSSLDGIGNLIRVADRSLATTALARLSDLLRYVLRSTGNETPSMTDEIGFAKAYLSLQELRYGQHLQVNWTLSDNEWCAVSCPPLLLHSVIEQALHWSVTSKQGNHVLLLNLEQKASMVQCCITVALEAAIASPDMTQIDSVRERLAILYTSTASLDLLQDKERICITMLIPVTEFQDT